MLRRERTPHALFAASPPGGTVALRGVGIGASMRRNGRGPRRGPEFRELLLRPDARELRRARWLTDSIATEHGLGEDERFRFTFAANEAVANAIEHGAPSREGHILVRCSSTDDSLVFEVHDWGCFAPEVAPAGSLQDRGRGLALMATMVDEVDVKPDGESTVVRLVLHTVRPLAA